MIELNQNYYRLKREYLFDQIDEEIKKSTRYDIINLSVGDTTLPLTKTVLKAVKRASCEMGKLKTFRGYPPILGYDFFKEAIISDYKNLGIKVDKDEIFVNDGAKTDLFSLLIPIKGDVIIPNPIYPAYLDQSIISGLNVDFVNCTKQNNFLPTPYDIKSFKKGKSAIIYICSPANPSGAVYDYKALKMWVDYANKTGSIIIFDSAYKEYIRGDYPKSIFQLKDAENCAVEVCSLSKSANLTGIRCGFTIVKKQLRLGGESFNKVFTRFKCAVYNGVSYISQRAGEAALSKKGKAESFMVTEYYRQNAMILKKVLIEKGIFCMGGDNSPYVFFECPCGVKSYDYMKLLIHDVGIATTPGVGFNSLGEGFLRITGFSSRKSTLTAAKRLQQFL